MIQKRLKSSTHLKICPKHEKCQNSGYAGSEEDLVELLIDKQEITKYLVHIEMNVNKQDA